MSYFNILTIWLSELHLALVSCQFPNQIFPLVPIGTLCDNWLDHGKDGKSSTSVVKFFSLVKQRSISM